MSTFWLIVVNDASDADVHVARTTNTPLLTLAELPGPTDMGEVNRCPVRPRPG
jgi:hypothetical protein